MGVPDDADSYHDGEMMITVVDFNDDPFEGNNNKETTDKDGT